MNKGYIGYYMDGTLVQEEFNDFEISENSNWFMLPWASDFDNVIYNCNMTASPGNNYTFNKQICKWESNGG